MYFLKCVINMSSPDIEGILNKRVSVTTNSNIRYEGVLIEVKKEEKKITLKEVESFGTEGRNKEIGKAEMPAPEEKKVYPLVEFKITMV